MNVEGKNEVKMILEYQVTAVTDRNHGWMLKLVSQSMRRNRIFAESQNISLRDVLILKGKNSNFAVRNPTDTTLMVWLRWTSLIIRHFDIMDPLRRARHFCSILPKNTWLEFNHDNHQTNPNWGVFYKIMGECFSRHLGHERQQNSREVCRT